jgi:hypothetical protein
MHFVSGSVAMSLLPMCFLIFASLISISCSNHSQIKNFSQDLLQKQSIEKYRKQYKAYQTSATNLPSFDKIDIHRLTPKLSLYQRGELRLELVLGQRWATAQNAIFRTESRYVLTKKNRILASAESTLATDDLAHHEKTPIQVFFDAKRHACLIAEQQSWATFRYIIIQPAPDRYSYGSHHHSAWTVEYIEIPLPYSPYPQDGLPNILGLHDDHIYLKQDEQIYAFPAKVIPRITVLSYPMG